MKYDINQIRELADLAHEKHLAELTISDGSKSITVKTPASSQQVNYGAPMLDASALTASVVKESTVEDASFQKADSAEVGGGNFHTVTSPMVGTYYGAPAPGAPNFVDVGSTVSVGQTLCIIEAMKLMNELESDVSGKVVKILAQNGKPVEFGQPLLVIDPNG